MSMYDEPAPDAHLEMAYEDRVSGTGDWAEGYDTIWDDEDDDDEDDDW